jgi:hypothetical protein
MYSKLPNLVIGFHGCDKSVADKVLKNHEIMYQSKNDYDWLGNGVYFWEQNLERAWEWAEQHSNAPAVIGAVIDLGRCLNLCDKHHINAVKEQYKNLSFFAEIFYTPLPQNTNANGNSDYLLRYLDCAVIESLHNLLSEKKQPAYDTVRGVFLEGDPIYPNAGFRNKTHIQICVRNPNCIKGFFSPREIDSHWDIP